MTMKVMTDVMTDFMGTKMPYRAEASFFGCPEYIHERILARGNVHEQRETAKYRFDICTSGNGLRVFMRAREQFAAGQSLTAVQRKLRRHAAYLGLRTFPAPPHNAAFVVTFDVHSSKDWRRLGELMKFANGRKLAATAANNYGR